MEWVRGRKATRSQALGKGNLRWNPLGLCWTPLRCRCREGFLPMCRTSAPMGECQRDQEGRW